MFDAGRLIAVMFCPACNTILDPTPVGDPCPGCGGTRRSATAYAEAALRATNVAERDHLVRQAARARAADLTGPRHRQRYPDDARS